MEIQVDIRSFSKKIRRQFFCCKIGLHVIISGGIPGIFGQGILGASGNTVILVNATGLKIVRVSINDRTYEDIANRADKILVNVTPRKHHMMLVFRGGAHIDWNNFDFRNIHEIVFDLEGNRVAAHPK